MRRATVTIAGPSPEQVGPSEQSCGGCRYYWVVADLPAKTGFCLRFPPMVEYTEVKGRTATRFATTQEHWWCGEFKSTTTTEPTPAPF
jgi:hypothetical protein